MKKLVSKATLAALLLAATTGSAFAYETATMQVQVSGAQKDKYYICVSNVGCLRMSAKQENIPINTMDVRYIFLANTATYQMYPQTLPNSCQVSVSGNQKLVVKGNVAKSGNKVYIANLHCSVV